jgi:hypothetical protein
LKLPIFAMGISFPLVGPLQCGLDARMKVSQWQAPQRQPAASAKDGVIGLSPHFPSKALISLS